MWLPELVAHCTYWLLSIMVNAIKVSLSLWNAAYTHTCSVLIQGLHVNGCWVTGNCHWWLWLAAVTGDCLCFLVETRYKYVTFGLAKQSFSRDLWHKLYDMSGDRFFTLDLLTSRSALEIAHKLVYQPLACKGVRVGANELDELRAVTIHYDSLCICGSCLQPPYSLARTCLLSPGLLSVLVGRLYPYWLVWPSIPLM